MVVFLDYYGKAPKFNQAILPILYLTSCIFLATGLRKIKEVMSKISTETVSERHFVLHFATFALFLLGQIPNIILGIILGYKYEF
jgi:formate-dependent nitrite reductase membrane component NrfD